MDPFLFYFEAFSPEKVDLTYTKYNLTPEEFYDQNNIFFGFYKTTEIFVVIDHSYGSELDPSVHSDLS